MKKSYLQILLLVLLSVLGCYFYRISKDLYKQKLSLEIMTNDRFTEDELYLIDEGDSLNLGIYKYKGFIFSDMGYGINDTLLFVQNKFATIDIKKYKNIKIAIEAYLESEYASKNLFSQNSTIFHREKIDMLIAKCKIFSVVDPKLEWFNGLRSYLDGNYHFHSLDEIMMFGMFLLTFSPFGFLIALVLLFLIVSLTKRIGLLFSNKGQLIYYFLIFFILINLQENTTPPVQGNAYEGTWYPYLLKYIFLITSFSLFHYLVGKIKIKSFVLREIVIFACFVIISYVVFMLVYQLALLLKIHTVGPFKWHTDSVRFFELKIKINTYLCAFVGLGSMIVNVISHSRKESKELKNLQIQQLNFEKNQMELSSLQARINPHFLYNALNSIVNLSDDDASKSKSMAYSLADFFKYSNNRENKFLATILEEKHLVQKYVDIEQIRFGNGLKYDIDIDTDVEDEMIPFMLLQPLVENAIKYGYDNDKKLIYFRLRIYKEKNVVFIKIYDSGSDFATDINAGFGLQSVQRKLRLVYEDEYELNFINKENKHVEIKIFSKPKIDIK